MSDSKSNQVAGYVHPAQAFTARVIERVGQPSRWLDEVFRQFSAKHGPTNDLPWLDCLERWKLFQIINESPDTDFGQGLPIVDVLPTVGESCIAIGTSTYACIPGWRLCDFHFCTQVLVLRQLSHRPALLNTGEMIPRRNRLVPHAAPSTHQSVIASAANTPLLRFL